MSCACLLRRRTLAAQSSLVLPSALQSPSNTQRRLEVTSMRWWLLELQALPILPIAACQKRCAGIGRNLLASPPGLCFTRRRAKRPYFGSKSMFASAPLPVALETVQVLANYDPQTIVAKVKVPVLFLHAEHDTVAPAALGKACAEIAPKGQLQVLANCGHLIVLDQKEEFHQRVRTFLAGLSKEA